MAATAFYAKGLIGGGANDLDHIISVDPGGGGKYAKDGDFAVVRAGGVKYDYQYDGSNNNATNPESSPGVIVPDDNTTGFGAWILQGARFGDVEAESVITGTIEATTQPLFRAGLSGHQTNVTGNGVSYSITGAIWPEWFDQAANFSNGTFTASATRPHCFIGRIVLDNIDSGHTYALVELVTSNETITIYSGALYTISASGQATIPINDICYMDAADTAYLQVTVYGGTQTVTVHSKTVFSGYQLP